MNFKKWLVETVTIDYSEYKRALDAKAREVIDYIQDREYKLQDFDPDAFLAQIEIKMGKYPKIKNFLHSLRSKNPYWVMDQLNRLRDWIDKQPYNRELRDLSRQTYDYLDKMRPRQERSGEEDIQHSVRNAMEETQKSMQGLQSTVESAMARVGNWNGSPVGLEVHPAQDERGHIVDSSSAAEVRVGAGKLAPTFMLWQGPDGLEVDDIIEGGEEDFFDTLQVQADYFNLINELKKPGSTQQGKTLTLYTARPKADREQYLKTHTLPVNIFLTNDYNHAEGIGRDMGERDIWKVRINGRYLTQTLDGLIKYYQVTTPDAPVNSITLITPAGEE